MRILFTHDHKFYKAEDGSYYSDGQYPYRLWEQYLSVFDEIVVAARIQPLTHEHDKKKLDLSSGPGVSFHDIPPVNTLMGKLLARQRVEPLFTKLLAECDGLIARTCETSVLAGAVAEKMNKPWLTEVVYCSFGSLWNHGNWKAKLYAPYSYYATRRSVAQAPFALYVTNSFLQKRYPNKHGNTIACSDVNLDCRDPEVLAFRLDRIHRVKRSAGTVRVGMIGTLTNTIKGIDVALEALGMINKRTLPFEFHILGGGDQQYWQGLAKNKGVADQTVFCGTLPQGNAVAKWLDEIDIYIQPSFTEGMPRALLEAMSRGCPAIASNVGGIPELLRQDCLHQPGDSSHLANLLKLGIENFDWQAEQAERNYHTAAQYDRQCLQEVRTDFWKKFAAYCRAMKK